MGGGALSNLPASTRGRLGGGGFWRRTPLSHLAHPPTFWVQGDTPCTLLDSDGGGAQSDLAAWQRGTLPRLPLHSGVGMRGLPRVRGQGQEWGLMVANAIIPPSPTSNVFWYRGTRCTPGGGCAPCTLLDGDGGGAHADLAAWQRGTLPNLPRTWEQVRTSLPGCSRAPGQGREGWGRSGRAPSPGAWRRVPGKYS